MTNTLPQNGTAAGSSQRPARKGPESAMEQNMDFSRVDDAPGLGKILWRHMKGTEPPWELPWDPDEDEPMPPLYP